MAEVFRATYAPEGGFRREVAVKRILPAYAQDESFVAMFLREAELGSLLVHRNIVQTLDVGRQGDSYFIAMELVDGLSLNRVIALHGEPLPPEAATFAAAELAAALAYLHERKDPGGKPLRLVHRDVTPHNVLVSRAGEVKLADFGILRAMARTALTTTGMFRGKVGYMPPEQLMARPMDGRGDLFGLGCTLYEALTARHPFTGQSDADLASAAFERRFEPLGRLRPDAPPALVELVHSLLEPDPELRPKDAFTVRNALLSLPPPFNPMPDGDQALAGAVARALAARSEAQPTASRDASQAATVKATPAAPAPTRRGY